MATLNLNPYKPASGQSVASLPIDNAFDAIVAAVNGIDNTQFAAGRIFDPQKLIEANSMQAIVDSVAGGALASFDFTGIPATFRHLLIVQSVRGDAAATSVAGQLKINNDAGANYDRQVNQASAASNFPAEALAQNAHFINDVAAATAPANTFSAALLLLPHYANSTENKTGLVLAGMKRGTVSGSIFLTTGALWWRSNAAINRLTFLPASGNFVADSRMTIYGLG